MGPTSSVPRGVACAAVLAIFGSSCAVQQEQVQQASAELGGAPDSNCTKHVFNGFDYWVCQNLRTWSQARSRCQAEGYELVRIDSAAENAFIDSSTTGDFWIGANDQQTEGAWRWSLSNTQFWQGSEFGNPVGGLYNAWTFGQPDGSSLKDCAQMLGNSWFEEYCSQSDDYVCEAGDLCPMDPVKNAPGQCGCGAPDSDTDGDGTADCNDGCDDDPGKTAPGVCGCGVSDLDSDNDGTPDCNEECPFDPDRTVPPCAPEDDCTLEVSPDGRQYFFCTHDRTWTDARAKCLAVAQDLVRIDDQAENDFIESQISTPDWWIGGSDRVTENTWTWTIGDDAFWTGSFTGGPVNGLYTNWAAAEPDGLNLEDCAQMLITGQWYEDHCDNLEEYVCEIDQCPDDPLKFSPGDCGCGLAETDADDDGSADCADLCKDDPEKSAPGVCGCGEPDDDTDQDGIADCKDECPNDVDPTAGGTCGCPSAPAPQGTPCCDGICGGGVCDGDGHCGDPPATCEPNAACSCEVVRIDGDAYWYCPCSTTRGAADALCTEQPGRTLIRIGDENENAFVAAQLDGNAWLAGTDRALEGTWRWSTPQHGDEGPTFWVGNQTGAAHFARYANWASDQPSGGEPEDCQTMRVQDGRWADTNCTTAAAHVACETGLRRSHCTPPDIPDGNDQIGQPDSGDITNGCVDYGAVFVEPTRAATEQQFRDCTTCVETAANPQVDCVGASAPCSGSATPAPPGNPVCSDFGDGYVCRVADAFTLGDPVERCEDGTCSSGECGLAFFCSDCPENEACPCETDIQCGGSPNRCESRRVCGTLIDECPNDDDNDVPCDEVNICPGPDTLLETGSVTGLNPGSEVTTTTAQDFENEFGTPTPPSDEDRLPGDPPCPGSADPDNCEPAPTHAWCHYAVKDDVGDRDVPLPPKQGNTGDSSKLRFNFEPNIDYDYVVTPGPFGLMQFRVQANASLKADVNVNLLGAMADLDVIDAVLEARGGLSNEAGHEICGVTTEASHLKILETADLLPMTFKKSLPADQDACIAALGEFQAAVDKAKKAYSDARELLRQYHDLRAGGENFGIGLDGFCDQIASDPPLDLPPIPVTSDCLTEAPEATINRFIDHYIQLALGGVANDAANDLSTKVDEAFGATLEILDLDPAIGNTEEIVIFTGTFPVGPIPVTMQVLLTAAYGVNIDGELEFNPSTLIRQMLVQGPTSASEQDPLAFIGVSAEPFAGSSVALFVGVGFDFGIAAAKVGIEGSVSLGKIAFPLEAGAGLTVGAVPDDRPAADDIDPEYVRVDAAHPPLIPMKRYEIHGMYRYGARMELTNLLDGAIDVAVKLKFLFFSKKFRARIIQFSGLCRPSNPEPFCNVDIFGGYGNIRDVEIPIEMVDWGSVLMPHAFYQLIRIDPGSFAEPGGASFDPGRAGAVFYDGMCSCIKNVDDLGMMESSEPCSRSADCCGYDEGDFCFADPEDSVAKCTDCRAVGASCNTVSDCCESAAVEVLCFDDPAPGSVAWPTCQPKRACTESCNVDSDCNRTAEQPLVCNPSTNTCQFEIVGGCGLT
jgi:hypothetical protein